MPNTGEDGTLAQILIKLGELGTQVAVLGEKMNDLPDHESRLRYLERTRPGKLSWVRDAALMAPMYGLVVDLIATRH